MLAVVIRRCVSLLALGFAIALLAACGGDGDGSGDAPPPNGGTGADEARAKAAAFRLADFPQGWKVDGAYKPRTGCREYEDGLTETARIVTAFTKEDIVDADSTVLVFATEAEARTAFARLDSRELRTCYQRDVARKSRSVDEVRSGKATFGDITVAPVASRDYGDETAALQLVVELRQDGINIRLQSDSVIVRRERAVLIANFSTANTGFETALMIGLLKAATGRLAPT